MSKLGSAAATLIAGGAMLVLSMSPGSAFTLSSPNLESSVASSQIDKVWWHGGWHHGWGGGWGWHHAWGYGGGWGGGGWGYGGGWGPHCWRGYWGHLHCNY